MAIKVIDKLKHRHGQSFTRALFYELFVRVYQHRAARVILKQLFPKKQPKGWFFVTGCYNAGTTLIKDVISIHPNVACAPIEGDLLTSNLPQFEQGGFPRAMYGNAIAIKLHREENILNVSEIVSDWRPWISTEKYFCEKSISHSTRIKLLRNGFKGCRFVCVTRDPADVISGIQRRSVPVGMAKVILDSAVYPRVFLEKQYAYLYGLMLEDYSNKDSLFCSYEKFIANPIESTEEMYEFLGLPPVSIAFEHGHLCVDQKRLHIRSAPEKTLTSFDSYDSVKTIVHQINDSSELD